jgi:hypothetical protein
VERLLVLIGRHADIPGALLQLAARLLLELTLPPPSRGTRGTRSPALLPSHASALAAAHTEARLLLCCHLERALRESTEAAAAFVTFFDDARADFRSIEFETLISRSYLLLPPRAVPESAPLAYRVARNKTESIKRDIHGFLVIEELATALLSHVSVLPPAGTATTLLQLREALELTW